MTYDVLLSLRGWGRAEFESASPDFLAGARHALFAEKLAPLLTDAESVMAMPMPTDPVSKLDLAKRKMSAQAAMPAIRRVLFPEDDDG